MKSPATTSSATSASSAASSCARRASAKGIIGGFKALGGGNIKEFIEVCESARHDAYQHMIEHATEVGADAIIGMRYDAGEFSAGVTEVLCYGTAVKLMPRVR